MNYDTTIHNVNTYKLNIDIMIVSYDLKQKKYYHLIFDLKSCDISI
jgi:hypothetical protein